MVTADEFCNIIIKHSLTTIMVLKGPQVTKERVACYKENGYIEKLNLRIT
jgi:hypothetical protein